MSDRELEVHREWLGLLQPVGLVVSPAALVAAQAFPNRNIGEEHERFLDALDEQGRIRDLPALFTSVFGWRASDLVADPPLEAVLAEYDETLRADLGVRSPGADGWLLLVRQTAPGADLDAPRDGAARGWHGSENARLERLLRETGVEIGILSNTRELRLVHAPRGESSGSLTFPVAAMVEPSGRMLFAALHMLLESARVFELPARDRLPAILAASRRYQNEVSTALSSQVLEALHELLRGFQAADHATRGELLGEALRDDPDHVYDGLLTTLLRLVFILYAEERGLFPGHEVYARNYSVGGLFARLRADAERWPDTMDRRYGAWAQLLALFRLVHDGGRHGGFHFPRRHGGLFDPDRFPFLEGRPYRSRRSKGERITPPLVSDGVIHRVLGDLLVLDGERIAYRALDVEQIGSVYESSTGYRLKVAAGRSIAIKPVKAGGAPEVVDLDALLERKPAERAKAVRLPAAAERAVKSATSVEELLAAIGSRVSPTTPGMVAPGGMLLEPSPERRRSGSHYTPRALSEDIVKATLHPILTSLGPAPRPEEVLGLKVLDPAMGSGAFLVEATRQLGDVLVASWRKHGGMPRLPPDEDEVLHARRLVVQHCLYGVDKRPQAVDLAKLSLWLTTLARDHAFTFVDHALREGDSLVGLTRRQIEGLHWAPVAQSESARQLLAERVALARRLRERIQASGDDETDSDERALLDEADHALSAVRRAGDHVIAAFFAGETAKEREKRRAKSVADLDALLETPPEGLDFRPFHWEIEFPEVFERDRPGFDAIVGNPPFAGKNTIIEGNPEGYLDWLQTVHEEAHGNSDLVAHFYRRAFTLLRPGGAFGLLATKTIRQGDTRTTGLRWICTHGGTIYRARRRIKWAGEAAVVVSIVNVIKGPWSGPRLLDGREVPEITAFLFHAGGSEDPAKLTANEGKSFQGSIVLGMGFTFDDTDKKGVASPIAEMERLIAKDRRNAERIFPYIGGEEVNDSPTHAHHRYVINFGEMSEEEARRWPDLLRIVEERVKPQRDTDKREIRKRYWWRFAETTPALFEAIRDLDRVVAISRVTEHAGFAKLPAPMVYSERLVVFPLPTFAAFASMQSRIHELWARFFSATLEDRLMYAPSDCFETFPFPPGFESLPGLEAAGREYYEFRAALMVANTEGLTKTYNRFHDPDERSPEIARLRDLHLAMDKAVLAAYGWDDLALTTGFFLDYEDDDVPEGSKKKKPWRLRFPDDLQDTLLARLLALNRERSEAERLATPPSPGPKKKPRRPRPGDLFG